MIFHRFIQVAMHVTSSLIFIAERYEVVWKCQFNYSLIKGHLGYFQCLASTNKAALNIPAQVLAFDEDNYNSHSMANSPCLRQSFSEMGEMDEELVTTYCIKHIC